MRDKVLSQIAKKAGIKIVKESAEAIKRSAGKADEGRFNAMRRRKLRANEWFIPSTKDYARLAGQVGTLWSERRDVDVYYLDETVFVCKKRRTHGDFEVLDAFHVEVSNEEFEQRRQEATRRLVDAKARGVAVRVGLIRDAFGRDNGGASRVENGGTTARNGRGVAESLRQDGERSDSQSDNGKDAVYTKSGELVAYRIGGVVGKQRYKSDAKRVGLLFSFIGSYGAKTLDAATDPQTWELLGIRSYMQNLNTAREMEAAGKDRASILHATGWYRGKDKKWRREIDDGKIKDGIAPHVEEYGTKWLALGEFYEAPELYKAYPELKEMRVEFGFLRGKLASFDTVNEVIHLPLSWIRVGKIVSKRAKNSAGLLPTLVHEIQHAIQKIEGFTPGGTVGMSDPRHAIRIAELKGEITEYESSLELIEEEIYEAEDAGDSELAQSLNEELNTGREELERLKKELLDLEWSDTPTLDFEGYRRLAGEVEARNVSERLNNKRTAPWNTEDVAEEEQIVIPEHLFRYRGADADIRYLEYQGTIYGYYDPAKKELHLNEEVAPSWAPFQNSPQAA